MYELFSRTQIRTWHVSDKAEKMPQIRGNDVALPLI
jgi:hypothetical protein